MLRVNGELIDPELVEQTFSRIKSEAETRLQVSCCERDSEFMEEAEKEVADSILIAQEAERRFEKIPDDEVAERLEETFKLYREHGASWEMLEAQRDQLYQECAANLRMDKLIHSLFGGEATVTEEEVEAFYQENIADYCSDPEAHCLHLVKLLSEHDDPGALYLSMIELRKTAKKEDDFLVLAKKETEKPTGDVDLGWIPLDRPTNPFESILFSLEENEISPVIAYENAFHLIKVIGYQPGKTTTLEEVKDEITERALNHKKRSALRKLAKDLRVSAVIEHVDHSLLEE